MTISGLELTLRVFIIHVNFFYLIKKERYMVSKIFEIAL